MAIPPDDLQERLEQLEANVYRWQRINRFRVWSLLIFIVALHFYSESKGRVGATVHQALSARQVTLVDTQGNVRGLLGTHDDGSPFLRLETQQGTGMLAVDHNGRPRLVLEQNGQVVGQVP